MPVTYTNRKGSTFYLCQGATKTGKTRYYFVRHPKGDPVEDIPAGYVIRESVNGVVSLVKSQPELIEPREATVVEHLPDWVDVFASGKIEPLARKWVRKLGSTALFESFGPD